MMKKTAIFAIAAIAAIGSVGAGQIATSGIAKAQYNDEREDDGGGRYSRGRTPPMPAPGFEGFDGIDNYCTFRREPYRKCFNNKYGEQQCRTVGWRVIQNCY